jgi:hypothetical protein
MHTALVVLQLLTAPLAAAAPKTAPAPSFRMSPQSYNARHLRRAVTVDGRLDERDWKAAPRVGAFVDLASGRPDDKAIEAKLLWDEQTIYVAFRSADDNVTSTETSSDPQASAEDAVEVMIRERGAGRAPLSVRLAANGAVSEQNQSPPPPGQAAAPVRAAVTVQGTLDRPRDRDRGWTAELAIPLAALPLQQGQRERRLAAGNLWELNLYRVDKVPGRPARQLVWSRMFDRDPRAADQAGDLCLADAKGESPAQAVEREEEREERREERERERAERRR